MSGTGLSSLVSNVASVPPPPGWEWAYSISTNPLFAAGLVLMLNLGGRYLSMDLSKSQEQILTHPLARRVILFAVMFLATRNILLALLLTVVISLVVFNFLNEESPFYILSRNEPRGLISSENIQQLSIEPQPLFS